jgi:hypothetical protein
MRPSLSRLTVLVVIGLAFVAIPGVAVARAASRDAAARMTRGGFHRLGSSDAVLHLTDDHDPDTTVAGDDVGSIRQPEHAHPGPPGALPSAQVSVPRPATTFVLLDVLPVPSFHPAAVRTRTSGRAPPLF